MLMRFLGECLWLWRGLWVLVWCLAECLWSALWVFVWCHVNVVVVEESVDVGVVSM